ncbi:TDT family transporter [Cellulomonas sp. McL0617]|uniref:TDT family transporter n=1 Tax=Cellulomonas sp. McL0617 TaxID=3415675 RepID=UPI003CEEB5FC
MTSILERPAVVATTPRRLSAVGPNWYATVMGTGIVADAAVTLPHQVTGLHTVALLVWLLAVGLLVAVTVATVTHWRLHPVEARAHLRHPVMGNFYGAMPMSLLTVATGTLLLGRDLVGLPAALTIAWVLWVVGTLGGLVCAALLPVVRGAGSAFGGWLMPVVPPMVSAATGALLAAHLAPGPGRHAMVVLCYGLFGFSLLASAVVIPLVLRRLVAHGPGPAALVPTLWIVLGPLGQSITAAHLLGLVAGPGARTFGLAYGLVAWAAAMAWLAVVAVITVLARPPFGLPWWSFTFPLGTVVTGTSALAAATGWAVLASWAVVLYVGLVTAWLVVGVLTARRARTLLA